MSRQGVDYEQTRRLAAMVAPPVRRGGWKPKCLPTRDPHFRRAVVELVLKLAVEHVARVRAVAPLRPSGARRVLDERPADAIDYLLDVTNVEVMLRRGSVEGHDPRRGRTRAHNATKLMRTAVTRPRFCLQAMSRPSGSPRTEFSAGDQAALSGAPVSSLDMGQSRGRLRLSGRSRANLEAVWISSSGGPLRGSRRSPLRPEPVPRSESGHPDDARGVVNAQNHCCHR